MRVNDTNIALIPKCDSPNTMKNLWPILLCNVAYKVLSKLLANWLKTLLSMCITEEHTTFLEERAILDNVLVENETIHYLRCKTGGGMREATMKIDFSNAYDKINWKYVCALMKKMGFSERWVSWIYMCLNFVVYSVLMNNEQVGPVIPRCGK